MIADTYLTSNAERSKWFGPDAKTPEGFTNLDSDLFYQRIKDRGIVEEIYNRKPPVGPKPEVKQVVKGYVKGYNAYLKKTGRREPPRPDLRGPALGAPDHQDGRLPALLRAHPLRERAASRSTGSPTAQPPAAAARERPTTPPRPRPPRSRRPSARRSPSSARRSTSPRTLGSNAWGLGSDATADRRRHGARQPALPLAGAAALLSVAPGDPGRDERLAARACSARR